MKEIDEYILNKLQKFVEWSQSWLDKGSIFWSYLCTAIALTGVIVRHYGYLQSEIGFDIIFLITDYIFIALILLCVIIKTKFGNDLNHTLGIESYGFSPFAPRVILLVLSILSIISITKLFFVQIETKQFFNVTGSFFSSTMSALTVYFLSIQDPPKKKNKFKEKIKKMKGFVGSLLKTPELSIAKN